MIIVNPQACSENEHLYVECIALGKWWGSGKWLMTTARVAASLLTPLSAGEMIRDHHCFSIFFMGMKQRATFIVSMFFPLWKGFVCDPLWNMAVARGLVNPPSVKKKHDALKTEGEVLAMEKVTVGSASLPLPATLSGETEARALTPTPSAYCGACAPHRPGWISLTPWQHHQLLRHGVKKQSLKSKSKPQEEFNSPTSVFRLSLTLWFEVKLDCI